MSLLGVRPSSLRSNIIPATGGGSLRAAISNANAVPYRWDSGYAGGGDRHTSFGMYGNPTASTTPGGDSWNYNQTFVSSFLVNCNHSKWKFCTEGSVSGWTVEVFDNNNMYKVGDYNTTSLWDNGLYVRANPTANNSGGSAKYCVLYIGTYNNYMISGGDWYGVQDCQHIPPTFDFVPYGLSLPYSEILSYSVGSTGISIGWRPSGMATSPHTNYISVTKPGPVALYYGSRANCKNNVTINSFNITLSEAVQENVAYTIYIDYDP